MNWKVVSVIGFCVGAIAACGASQQDAAPPPGQTTNAVVLRGEGGSTNAVPAPTSTTADGVVMPERRNR